VLAPAIARTKADFKSTEGKIHSLGDILQRLTVGDLLDVDEDLVVGGLAVANAFLDGLIDVAENLVDWVKDLINEPIHVPVLTALYSVLTGGQQLTLLNLISLVCAIPLMLILRLADGAWPDFSAATAAEKSGDLGLTNEAKAFGILNGLCWLINGLTRGGVDYYTGKGKPAPPWLGIFLVILNFCRSVFAYPNVSGTADPLEWEAWGVNVFGTAEGLLLYTLAKKLPADKQALAVLGSILTAINSGTSIIIFSVNWSSSKIKNTAITRAKFAGQILSQAASVPNPIKFFGNIPTGIVVTLDVLCGAGAASCFWAVLGENWDK
jgi:hypothetical protein